MAATNAKIVPQPFFLLRSTAVLWVYPFWHTNGLVHETLPMAALVALTVVLTGCALLGQLRLSARGRVRAFFARAGLGRPRLAWGLGAVLVAGGLAAGGLVLSENLCAARRTVNPDRDRDDQVCGDDYFPVEE